LVSVRVPKGELTRQIRPEMKIEQKDGVITVSRPDDERQNRSLHGLSRTLIHNMIVGVTDWVYQDFGYSRRWLSCC